MTNPSARTSSGSSPQRPRIVVQVFGRTDVGRMREHNEDAFVIVDLTTGNSTLQPEVLTHASGRRGSLFMVADGMGGAAAGEIASAMAVDIVLGELRERWIAAPTDDAETFARALRAATDAANRKIHQFALQHPEHRGMGTTATIAGLLGDTLYVAQVGDSRAYLVRDGVARQITKDQSLIQKLVEAGEITAEEAETSDRRNIILQALGPEANIRIDLTHQQVRRGDTLILCSDGLSGQVRGDEIARIVGEESDLASVCRRLIDQANDSGGPDNITVVAARFEGELDTAHVGDEVGHRVFPTGDDQTPTMPMERYDAGPTALPAAAVPPIAPPAPANGRVPGAPPPEGVERRPFPVWFVPVLVILLLAAYYLFQRSDMPSGALGTPRVEDPAPTPEVSPAAGPAAAPVAAPADTSPPAAVPDSSANTPAPSSAPR